MNALAATHEAVRRASPHVSPGLRVKRETLVKLSSIGAYLPERVYTTEEKIRIFHNTPDPDLQNQIRLDWINRLGIKQTHALVEIDEQNGCPSNLEIGDWELGIAAVEQALHIAHWRGQDVQQIFWVTCTHPTAFSESLAYRLKAHLVGCNRTTKAHVIGTGCGGSVKAIAEAAEKIKSGVCERALLVFTNCASCHFWRDACLRVKNAWLSHFIFCDMGVAMTLEGTTDDQNLLIDVATYNTDPRTLVQYSSVSGKYPRTGEEVVQHIYQILPEVPAAYEEYMDLAMEDLFAAHQDKYEERLDMSKVFFVPHQVNATVLQRYIKTRQSRFGFDPNRVAINVDRLGNGAAATIPYLLYETLRDGKLHTGDRLVAVGMGDGVDYGGFEMVMGM